jgi:dihydroxyacid dehydratase/phosphogluconate dehydratase
MEFPVHLIAEQSRRPTAALDRNLAYLGLVEILHGYPLDGVVLTTGCDKTTPACLMAAATTDLPSIVLSGGPMLDGHHKGELIGSAPCSGTRNLMAAGEIDYEGFMEMTTAASPSVGHCNTMGTALSMNALAEALGMSARLREHLGAHGNADKWPMPPASASANLMGRAPVTDHDREAFENAIPWPRHSPQATALRT